MGKNIYLYEDNAEEFLPEVISLIKNKIAFESRKQAFEECTKFWGEHLGKIINSDASSDDKISQIKRTFEIK